MTIDLGLLIGLISIALALFLGLFFGLAGFRKGVTSELSVIKDAVNAIRTTVDKTWDLVVLRFSASSGTVERELENLGKIKISAEPGEKETKYIIEIEKPIFHQEYIVKMYKERGLVEIEKKIFGKELNIVVTVFSPTRMRLTLPCMDPKPCTEYMTLVLKWLDSTYFESLGGIKEFEESILT